MCTHLRMQDCLQGNERRQEMTYPIKRDLDGAYFRIERDGRWQNVCFSDMTRDERDQAMEGRSEEWLKSMCHIEAEALHQLGDELGVVFRSDDCRGDE